MILLFLPEYVFDSLNRHWTPQGLGLMVTFLSVPLYEEACSKSRTWTLVCISIDTHVCAYIYIYTYRCTYGEFSKYIGLLGANEKDVVINQNRRFDCKTKLFNNFCWMPKQNNPFYYTKTMKLQKRRKTTGSPWFFLNDWVRTYIYVYI